MQNGKISFQDGRIANAGTVGRFEERKKIPSMENEIYKTGVVIYER